MTSLKNISIFTDGSVDPESKVGFGAYFVLRNVDCSLVDVNNEIILTRFNNTSSTRIELETLLHALSDPSIKNANANITIYTDSQNTIGLPDRRARLEENNYYSRSKKLVRNHELYKQFYLAMDEINFCMVKIKGHRVHGNKSNLDKIFSVVDRASRKALRESVNTTQSISVN